LLLGMALSVCTRWFHSIVTLPHWPLSTDFGTCSYQCFLSNCTPVSLHMLKCSYYYYVSWNVINLKYIEIKFRFLWAYCFIVQSCFWAHWFGVLYFADPNIDHR
jgi:hypothetical protein